MCFAYSVKVFYKITIIYIILCCRIYNNIEFITFNTLKRVIYFYFFNRTYAISLESIKAYGKYIYIYLFKTIFNGNAN